MFTVKLTIPVPDGLYSEDLADRMYTLVGNLRRSGQLAGPVHVVFTGRELEVHSCCLERSALDMQNANQQVHQARDDVTAYTGAGIAYEITGCRSAEEPRICGCKSSFLILFTNFVSESSPLRCGDCFAPLPLYRFPYNEECNFHEILGWEKNYQACDRLQIGSEVGVRFGLRELSDVKSALSAQGRALCDAMSKSLKIPVFYYLYNHRKISKKKDQARKCPGCGGKWLLQEPRHVIFAFKCDKCRLLSNLSFYG